MLIRISGGSSGIKEYLEHGQKSDRYYFRDELDTRAILNGDLETTDAIINTVDDRRDKYLHITLAFKEDSIPEEMLKNISQEFREFYFKAYNDDELHYYAEAHLPKIKSYLNAKTGEMIERKPHIHIVVPTINLINGKPVFPSTKINIKFIDAFQEHINSKYGLASPKNNPRYKINENSELISRYKGDGFKGKNREFREQIFDEIIAKKIGSFPELKLHLEQSGYAVKIRNEGKSADKEYYNIIGKDGTSLNLRDKVFQAEFLSKSIQDKIESMKSDMVYVEPAKNGKKTDYEYQELLTAWNDYKAYEYKYLNSASELERNRFNKLPVEMKKKYILLKQNEFYKDIDNAIRRDIAEHGTNGREELEQNYSNATTGNIRAADETIADIGDTLKRSDANQASFVGRERRQRIAERYARIIGRDQSEVRRNPTDFTQYQYQIGKYNPVDEISNRIKLTTVEIRELAVKYNAEIQADVLLELLEKTHGVNPELYRLTKDQNGADRVGCGSRNLNITDFCVKEMHLSLKQSIDVLNNVYNMQQDINREPGCRKRHLYLSQEYREWFKEYKAERARIFTKHKDDFKSKRIEIIAKYQDKIAAVKANESITYKSKREQTNVLKIDKLLELESLSKAKAAADIVLRGEYNLEMQKAYRTFLVSKANNGDEASLTELKRLRIKFEDIAKSGAVNYVDRYQEYKLNITYKVDDNGVINYQHNGKTIIQDHGKRVSIVKRSDENVKLILDLAVQKFGANIALTGSESFRRRAVEVAVKNNCKINFTDEFSKSHYKKLITDYKANYEQLNANKQALFAGKPQTLFVSGIGHKQVISNNGRCSKATALEFTNPRNGAKYEVSGYRINFAANNLVKGQFVEVKLDSANDIVVRSSDLEREIRKARTKHIEQNRQIFLEQVKSDYGIIEPKAEYVGKLLTFGEYKGKFYAVIASMDGKTNKVWNNELKTLFAKQGIIKGSMVSVVVPDTRTVEVQLAEKRISIKSAVNIMSDILLDVDIQSYGKKYHSEYLGRVVQVKPVTLKSGRETHVVLFSDNLSGECKSIYVDNINSLKANDFAYLGETGFNRYDILQLNDKIETKRMELIGGNDNKSAVIGEISRMGLKDIRGNEVFFVELRTDVGVITKYGDKVRAEIEALGLRVGDGVMIEDKEQVLTIKKEQHLIVVSKLDKDIDNVVELQLEKIIETIEPQLLIEID
ncbi:MAG: hypothetical protein QG673_1910 [Pseudomonadota bacterium]|nr:hypothetical protein [Pseudomonadota bacterium]